jgi:hypothetical protein
MGIAAGSGYGEIFAAIDAVTKHDITRDDDS